jgi:hypothetical protein|tara:strand:+ start:14248 stop:14685 length:438 start_codon:yes stop_codon:yes gene_type:complete
MKKKIDFGGFANKSPYLALFLLKTLIPILAVIFVLSFITLSTNKICNYEMLDIIFSVDKENSEEIRNSKKYKSAEEFIKGGKKIIYYIADKSINFLTFFLKDVLKNHQFGKIDFNHIEKEHERKCSICIDDNRPVIKPKLCLNRF